MSDDRHDRRQWRFFGIDDDTVWSIILDDVPKRISALKRLQDQVN